ncbi:hypothetical protein [Clostridium sp. Marseille-Q2269]|uniref:hypothetical protein n=1 Tax=Clostridium sp. Marseille-Q2269 TaxID=2942205 RepID=UPI0020741748|nr:hypothetical protein [Clostridium sp. Marseille-Q2269]
MNDFFKYILNLVVNSIIIIDLSIFFLYYNSHLKINELIGCGVTLFIIFNALGIKYWFKNKQKQQIDINR